jgi:ribosomal protein S11
LAPIIRSRENLASPFNGRAGFFSPAVATPFAAQFAADQLKKAFAAKP